MPNTGQFDNLTPPWHTGVNPPGTVTSITAATGKCHYCGNYHVEGVLCPRISEIEYYPDGMVKRVAFKW